MSNNIAILGVAVLSTAVLNTAPLSDDGSSLGLNTGGDGTTTSETTYLTDEDGNKITDEDGNYIIV